ncbi:hypothetical protein HPB50_005315 [Hyalomma asiaticum]|uniref:Uncharacterized protein n=1 Tax=Hyalomma asiaticum TaxID=266040 RepID=A0ACB7SF96_HYAAI|nr:hypothetical protein HPB50_005315 [Hyalomma asiaticum]
MVTTAPILAFMLASLATQSSAQDCPHSYRRRNPHHTACRPRNSWCKIQVSGVDATQRDLILKLHNQFRSQTAKGHLPGFLSAADMQELLWDEELAYVAQAHANLCTPPDGDLKHDRKEDRFTSRFDRPGQNLAWSAQNYFVDGPNWTWAMDGWFTKEYGLYPSRYIPEFRVIPGVKIGHFTQVVWSMSRYVGCGYTYYNVDGAELNHMKHYACNYGPGGNYLREPVYKEGPTCSACPSNTSCNEATGLCDGQSVGLPTFYPPSGHRTSRRPWPTPYYQPTWYYRRRTRSPQTPSEPPWPGQTGGYCPPCPCLYYTPQRYTPYRYQTTTARYPPYRYRQYSTARRRRYPPYVLVPDQRRYPLPYDPRLSGGLPRCDDVQGQQPCVEDDSGLDDVFDKDDDATHDRRRTKRGMAYWPALHCRLCHWTGAGGAVHVRSVLARRRSPGSHGTSAVPRRGGIDRQSGQACGREPTNQPTARAHRDRAPRTAEAEPFARIAANMATTAAILVFLLAMVAAQSSAQNCPDQYRRRNPQHTACKPPNSWCKIKIRGVDATQRALILKLHNDYRSQVAKGQLPGFKTAADMLELLWDDELAYVAQAHANLCTPADGDLKHDKKEDRFTNHFERTGQNLAWTGNTHYIDGPNWTQVLYAWVTEEYVDYPPRYTSQFREIPNVQTGHFTQAIWSTSRYVGCGYTYYNIEGAKYYHMKHYACNYGPTGNFLRQPIYKEGPTCSACPMPYVCNQATGLCDGKSSEGPPPMPPPILTPTSRPKPAPTPYRQTPRGQRTRTRRPQQPGAYCPPCRCLVDTPKQYPPYGYPPNRNRERSTTRRRPPYVLVPDERRYPLPYEPRLSDRLPRCEDVDGQQPCAEDDGASGGAISGDDEEAHNGRPAMRASALWLPFVVGCFTGLALAMLSRFVVSWRFAGSSDLGRQRMSPEAAGSTDYSGKPT